MSSIVIFIIRAIISAILTVWFACINPWATSRTNYYSTSLKIIFTINAVNIISAVGTVFLPFLYKCSTDRTMHYFHLKDWLIPNRTCKPLFQLFDVWIHFPCIRNIQQLKAHMQGQCLQRHLRCSLASLHGRQKHSQLPIPPVPMPKRVMSN